MFSSSGSTSEQDRPAGADDLEGKLVDCRVERRVEAEAEVVRRGQSLDPVDVVHGLARREVVAVGAGERVAVTLVQLAGPLVAGVVDESVAEVVRPGARRRRAVPRSPPRRSRAPTQALV